MKRGASTASGLRVTYSTFTYSRVYLSRVKVSGNVRGVYRVPLGLCSVVRVDSDALSRTLALGTYCTRSSTERYLLYLVKYAAVLTKSLLVMILNIDAARF